MITATRRIQFCAGHRVHNHESKCRNMHGHNYVALFTAQGGTPLDDLGRVIDFSVLKDKLGTWIDQNWDHGFIYWEHDKEISALFETPPLRSHKGYALPNNPTAENMARYLLEVVGPSVLSSTGVKLVKVELWETENCFATVTL